MSRTVSFILGLILGLVVMAPLGMYLFAKLGGIAMATSAQPLPLEKTIARTALRASVGDASRQQNPLTEDETNLLAGAAIYRRDCAVCHGVPGQPETPVAKGEFPAPPQLFEPKQMVVKDPQGTTYWKISHGIRLSGMPGFANTMSDNERWQITLLLAHADKLSEKVKAALRE